MFVHPQDVNGIPQLHPHEGNKAKFSPQHTVDDHHHRSLGSNDNFQSLLVDKNGNEYDPYSLAWRYLGLYIDCDTNDGDSNHDRRNRQLHSGDEGGKCERKLLWAAYVDSKYKGLGIEEYQLYDIETGEWDDTACVASGDKHRCVRLDCHEP